VKLHNKSAAVPVRAALNFATLEASPTNPDQFAIITYDFFLDVEDGPLSGNWRGFFSYDQSALSGIGTEEIGIKEFQLKINKRNFDGCGTASVFLEGGDLIGLNWKESWEFSKSNREFITRSSELWSIFDFRFVCTREVRRERLKTGELLDLLQDESSYGLVRYEKRQLTTDFRAAYRRRGQWS
jgi:hypothetical protein